jgi:hypothetical protein
LTQNDAKDFEVASTPSHRSRQHGTRSSPLLYFVDILVNQSEGKLPDTVRLRAMKLILEPCFNAQNTRLGRLEFLRDCASAVDATTKSSVVSNFWAHVAARHLGQEYDTVVGLLEQGSYFFLSGATGQDILSSFIDTVRKEAGESALILAVIEKVSERVLKQTADDDRPSCLPFTSTLLRNLPKQTSRRSLEQCRQLLWPSSPALGRQSDFDPYNHIYAVILSVGSAAYQSLGNDNHESTREFLASLATSITDCTTSHLAVYLRKTQDVIQTWVEDAGRKMQSSGNYLKALHREVHKLGPWMIAITYS